LISIICCRDKKASPDSGFCEAVFVEYLHNALGSVFTHLVNMEGRPRGALSSNEFTDAVAAVIARHPSATAFLTHYQQFKTKGKSTKGKLNGDYFDDYSGPAARKALKSKLNRGDFD